MKVDLDKKDIIALLRGSDVPYSVMDKIPENLGHYVGGFVDEWRWYHISEETQYSEEYLYDLYLMCKNNMCKND